jgi:hypothetical protein
LSVFPGLPCVGDGELPRAQKCHIACGPLGGREGRAERLPQ